MKIYRVKEEIGSYKEGEFVTLNFENFMPICSLLDPYKRGSAPKWALERLEETDLTEEEAKLIANL